MTPRPDFKNCDACELPRSCQGVRHCAKHHRPRDPQSLRCRVEAAVAQHGPCTVDAIEPLLPDYTREQILNALAELRKTHRLVMTERGPRLGRGRGSAPATYDTPERGKPYTRPAPRPMVASVFDLWRLAA